MFDGIVSQQYVTNFWTGNFRKGLRIPGLEFHQNTMYSSLNHDHFRDVEVDGMIGREYTLVEVQMS